MITSYNTMMTRNNKLATVKGMEEYQRLLMYSASRLADTREG